MSRAVDLSIAFVTSEPGAAAHALEQVSPTDAAAFISELENQAAATVLEHMHAARAADIMAHDEPARAARVLSAMPAHTRLVLLRTMPRDMREAVLREAPMGQGALLRRNLDYAPTTVGAWMDTPKATFAPDVSVGDCLASVRRLGARVGSFVAIVDEDERLLGTAPVDSLLGADDATALSAVMRAGTPHLSPHATMDSIVSLPAWDTALSLPVCDRGKRLVGVLDFESVREALAASRGHASELGLNNVVVHLAQTFLVTMSGLLNLTMSSPDITRLNQRRET